MLRSTVLPSLWNKSNLLIVCSEGLEFKYCDKCTKTIEDDICFCNNCKKCLHLECAGVEKRNSIIALLKHEKVLPAPEELPKSCSDCLISMRSIDNVNRRNTNSQATIQQKPTGSSVARRSNNTNRRNTKSPAAIQQKPIGSNVASSSKSAFSLIAGYLGSTAKNTLISSMKRIVTTIQPPHELSKDKYDDCLDHIDTEDHELEIKPNGTFYSCFGCKGNSFGPHYACRNSSCSVQFHEDCKSPRKLMMHPFFPEPSFPFSSLPKHGTTVNCNACGMEVKGYLYHGLNGYLHPCCANLPRQIICGESKATMVLQPSTNLSCSYCKQATSQIWSYVSLRDKFHLHVPCIMQMLSNLMSSHVIGSTSLLTILPQKTDQVNYSMTKLKFKIAADAEKQWENEFTKKKMKYVKIALGAIIATVLGDPTTFIFNCVVTFES